MPPLHEVPRMVEPVGLRADTGMGAPEIEPPRVSDSLLDVANLSVHRTLGQTSDLQGRFVGSRGSSALTPPTIAVIVVEPGRGCPTPDEVVKAGSGVERRSRTLEPWL